MSTPAEQPDSPQDVSTSAPSLPAIVAAFLVKFDDRKGYMIAWQRCAENVNLESVVEFKSMPSGLHNIREDLVYFVHEDCAGVSAVLNVEDEQAARKARVIAVGALVPLEHGRLGRSWLHAQGLKELAEKQIHNTDDYTNLEQFWEQYKVAESPEPLDLNNDTQKEDLTLKIKTGSQANGYQKNRSMSIGTVNAATTHVLPAHHPARVLPEFLYLFGPLIFPLVRAALLRKRILFLGESPVEKQCNYVYNLSILSSLPKPIATILPNLDSAYVRLRPLFNIGVADIPFLESEKNSPGGWIACTTDDVLCTKPDLFDLLVILPNEMSQLSNTRTYPQIFMSSSELNKARPKYGLRASQRDAKRFATLWKGLHLIPRSMKENKQDADTSAIASSSESLPGVEAGADADETASIASTSSTYSLKAVVEPQSWSRIAYTSLVWWASAGDKRTGLTEAEENEDEQDVALLTGDNLDEDDTGGDGEAKTREVACVQYFQRLSNLMFTTVGEAVKRSDGYQQRYRDDEDEPSLSAERNEQQGEEENRAVLPDQPSKDSTNDKEEKIEITQEDIHSMGLDVWSATDRHFVEEFVHLWWERDADVQSGRIECCGMRIL